MHGQNHIIFYMPFEIITDQYLNLYDFTGILSLMTKLKIRVMYSTKSPLISYSSPNTLAQNLIASQHIHTILKSTCSQRELPCMITTASTERHTPPSAHATDVLQHCHKDNYVHSLRWNAVVVLLLLAQ